MNLSLKGKQRFKKQTLVDLKLSKHFQNLHLFHTLR